MGVKCYIVMGNVAITSTEHKTQQVESFMSKNKRIRENKKQQIQGILPTDLAWPQGIQQELSEPIALMLNESSETLSIASQAGFRCFVRREDLLCYVRKEILFEEIQA